MSDWERRLAEELRDYNLTELRWKQRDARDDLREIQRHLDTGELDGEDPEWWSQCHFDVTLRIVAIEAELRRRGLEA